MAQNLRNLMRNDEIWIVIVSIDSVANISISSVVHGWEMINADIVVINNIVEKHRYGHVGITLAQLQKEEYYLSLPKRFVWATSKPTNCFFSVLVP